MDERKIKKITGIFNQFAGREVPLKDVVIGILDKDFNKEIISALRPADLNNPTIRAMLADAYKENMHALRPDNDLDHTIRAMQTAAYENGINLRVEFPGIGAGNSTSIVYPTPAKYGIKIANPKECVNARVEKLPDGKYRVSDKFSIGPTPGNVRF